MDPDMKHLFSAGSGYTCCKCLSPASSPCRAACGHIACMKCWKQTIPEKHACPECGQTTKFRQLKRLYFNSGPLNNAPPATNLP
ncbi:hypothetical protein CAPTEDRAFT_226280 [Capitella teleta]|uniref:RING-type domain-containing protein n=1 Tax=Capitella teleta TaxID=283909 RepID=R7TVE5_CAPTE|nr:hypothetical protein CAPTEDRAFT_226280 [Capitella teleta]|eukprot:ELT95436.1 hypothetical protein CAPTEDRAFT_226280 [Capitella teleta]